jgi:2-methylcitrate dehydratase PrpD
MMSDHPSRELAAFAAELRFEDIPPAVIDRAEDLFLDWFASALASKGSAPVEAIACQPARKTDQLPASNFDQGRMAI